MGIFAAIHDRLFEILEKSPVLQREHAAPKSQNYLFPHWEKIILEFLERSNPRELQNNTKHEEAKKSMFKSLKGTESRDGYVFFLEV
jgi:hypothetical protein